MSLPANRNDGASASSNHDSTNNSSLSQYKILALTFNQDGTSLAMGTLKNYALFTIVCDNELNDVHNGEIQPFFNIPYLPYEEVHIIERLFSSSLIAIVSCLAPRTLKVCHFQKGSEICSYSFPNTIVAVKLNRSRLIVCLEDIIFIHNMVDMKVLHTIRDVPSNHDGLCALSINDKSPYLAYPGSTITGEIQIFDTDNLRPSILISAHESPLAAMTFDRMGAIIATASNRGTVIRIHSVMDGTRLFEFRRGVRRLATIYTLAFSPNSMFLAASSNTETIHIFRLSNQQENPEQQATWATTFNRLLGGVTYYINRSTTEVLTQDRAFATVHLPSAGMKTNIALNMSRSTLKLYVASYDGTVSVYDVNTNEGGECKKVGHCLLFSLSQSSTNEQTRIKTDQQGPNNVSSGQPFPVHLSNQESGRFSRSSSLSNPQSSMNQTYSTTISESGFPELPPPPQGDDE